MSKTCGIGSDFGAQFDTRIVSKKAPDTHSA